MLAGRDLRAGSEGCGEVFQLQAPGCFHQHDVSGPEPVADQVRGGVPVGGDPDVERRIR